MNQHCIIHLAKCCLRSFVSNAFDLICLYDINRELKKVFLKLNVTLLSIMEYQDVLPPRF